MLLINSRSEVRSADSTRAKGRYLFALSGRASPCPFVSEEEVERAGDGG